MLDACVFVWNGLKDIGAESDRAVEVQMKDPYWFQQKHVGVPNLISTVVGDTCK